jgi:DNA-binding protein Fis
MVERVERELLTEVLAHTQGNITRAANLLGITRPTLRAKMAHLGLTIENKSTVTQQTT